MTNIWWEGGLFPQAGEAFYAEISSVKNHDISDIGLDGSDMFQQ